MDNQTWEILYDQAATLRRRALIGYVIDQQKLESEPAQNLAQLLEDEQADYSCLDDQTVNHIFDFHDSVAKLCKEIQTDAAKATPPFDPTRYIVWHASIGSTLFSKEDRAHTSEFDMPGNRLSGFLEIWATKADEILTVPQRGSRKDPSTVVSRDEPQL